MTKESERTLRIGELASALHIRISKIRYYERSGLIKEPPRDPSSGHRLYSQDDLRRLQFILRAQELGFTLKQISELLNLRVDRYNNCVDVRERIEEKSREISLKIQSLQALAQALDKMAESCRSKGPQGACPILEELDREL